jgi:hypothetical protein
VDPPSAAAGHSGSIIYPPGVLQVGDIVPAATVHLGPGEAMTIAELVEDGPKLLVFYLFDWSST